jgi:hypothetical protein
MAPDRFAAVVVNYNGLAVLPGCLASLRAAGIAEDRLVVVDNGSRDGSVERARATYPTARFIENGCNAGFARAVNAGLRVAEAEFVLVFNNDARLDDSALTGFAQVFDARPRAAILGGRLLHEDGRIQNAAAPFPRIGFELLSPAIWERLSGRAQRRKIEGDEPVKVESVVGASMAVRRSALPELGLLDEDFFFFMEETEWCWRARQRGFEVWHVPAARAVHGQGKTAKRYRSAPRIEFQRSKLIYYRKTAGFSAWLAVSVILSVRAWVNTLSSLLLCLLTLCLVSRSRQKAVVYWGVLVWHLLGRPATWGLPDKCPEELV